MWGPYRQNNESDCEAQCHAEEDPSDVSIVIEGNTVMEECGSRTKACVLLMGLIYALNLEYPQQLKNTFDAFQKLFLELDTGNYWRRSTASKVSSCNRHSPSCSNKRICTQLDGVVMLSSLPHTHKLYVVQPLSAHSPAVWFPQIDRKGTSIESGRLGQYPQFVLNMLVFTCSILI